MLVEVNPLIVTPDRERRARSTPRSRSTTTRSCRHPDNAELRDPSAEDPQEQMAKERGLTYVKLDGDIGILGNGAGLVMSTLDVVAQYGGKPANFLDAGGGSKAEAITSAVEVILSNPNVKAVLFNIFGGITRCDEVANGLVEAFHQIKPTVPFVVRLDGTNDVEGRRILAEAAAAQRPHGGDDERGGREGRGAGARRGPDERPRRQRDAPVRVGHHRPRGHVPRAEQPALRHAASSSGVTPGQGRPGRRGRPGLQHLPRTRSPRPARTRR